MPSNAERVKANEARIRLLQVRWPKCFELHGYRRKPLKVGIGAELLATGVLPAAELKAVLGFYTRGDGYLQALSARAERIDLDGKPAGEVTENQAEWARVELEARRVRKAAREASQPKAKAPTTVVAAPVGGKRPILKLPNRTVR
jgi:ProP effector